MNAVDSLQKALATLPQAELKFEHKFCGGIYARTMKAPASCLIVGRVHATENFFALTKGTITVWDEFNGVRTLVAPHVESAPVGIRRIGFTATEVEWTNFFATTETDVSVLEKTLELPRKVSGEPDENLVKLLQS